MNTNPLSLTRRPGGVTCVAVCVAMFALSPVALVAQGAPPLAVGSIAPDFSIKAVNASGTAPMPFKLSAHRGETVVLAFFPKARSGGCTMQMRGYRDDYATIFNGGKKVTLIGISIDPDTALTAWAKEERFPFLFGADADRSVGRMYGANDGAGYHRRVLYVVGPDGRIAYLATPFKQMAAEAYTELGAAIAKASTAR